MREEIELLKYHADFASHIEDRAGAVTHFDAIDDDASAVVLLQPVDAADQRRFA